MSSKMKYKERSRRSHHNSKPFATFERKAVAVSEYKKSRGGLLASLKTMFHRTSNK